MLLVSLRYVQYSMCRVTYFKVHYSMLLLLCGKVRYAMLARLWCYSLKCNVASFITLCSIFYGPRDKFQSALCYVASTMWQSALCYAGPSLVLHSKKQSSTLCCNGFSMLPHYNQYTPVDPLNTIINTVHTT